MAACVLAPLSSLYSSLLAPALAPALSVVDCFRLSTYIYIRPYRSAKSKCRNYCGGRKIVKELGICGERRGCHIYREGVPSGIPHILRIFGIRIPSVPGNSTRGYRKVGKSDFLGYREKMAALSQCISKQHLINHQRSDFRLFSAINTRFSECQNMF